MAIKNNLFVILIVVCQFQYSTVSFSFKMRL